MSSLHKGIVNSFIWATYINIVEQPTTVVSTFLSEQPNSIVNILYEQPTQKNC